MRLADRQYASRKATLIFVAVLLVALFTYAQRTDGGPSDRQAEGSLSGLVVESFETPAGTLKVNLPDDMMAGDTISGTVIAQPKRQKDSTPAQVAQAEDELSGYVVEIQQAKTTPKDEHTKFEVPKDATKVVITVKDKAGKEVGRKEVPVNPNPPAQGPCQQAASNPQTSNPQASTQANRSADPANFRMPTVAQAGRPLQICGPFDGNMGTTALKIGGEVARPLAESPRKAIFQAPQGVTGTQSVELIKKGLQVNGTIHAIAIKLAAPQLVLQKGQTTTLTTTVIGLQGVQETVPLKLTNKSPSVISMQGGDTQIIPISPAQAKGGTFIVTRTLTGIKPGGFDITATVKGTFLPPGVQPQPQTQVPPLRDLAKNPPRRLEPCTNFDLGAAATVIDFNDRPAGETIWSQYDARGVRFAGTAVAQNPSVATHSETMAATSQWDEFGSYDHPVHVDFRNPATAVGVYVGRDASYSGPVLATLTAYASDGRTVGSDEVMLPAETVPIMRCLVVRGANIRHAILQYVDESGASAYDARWFDDLTFVSGGTSGRDLPPVVTIDDPPDGGTSNRDSVVIRASVREDIALEQVQIQVNGTLNASAFGPDSSDPTLYRVLATPRGFRPGADNTVRVVAVDSAAQRGEATIHLRWQPPAHSDIWITGMEVTQAIQTLDNQIPLIGNKPTMVRVYVQSREDATYGPWTDVTARLTVRGIPGGRDRFILPRTSDPRSAIRVSTEGSHRERWDDSLNFVLDSDMVSPGARDLEVVISSISVRPETDTTNNRRTMRATFGAALSAGVFGVTMAMPGQTAPPWSDYELQRIYLQQTYPVDYFYVRPLPDTGTAPRSYADDPALGEDAGRILGRLPGGSVLNFLEGVDSCPCGYAWGAASRQQNNRNPANAPGTTMAQEVAHNFGMWWHTFPEGDPPRTPYPHRDETIGPQTGVKLIDADLPPLGAGRRLLHHSAATPMLDFMSYQVPNWISPYTYCTLLSQLSRGARTCPAGALRAGGHNPPAFDADLLEAALPRPQYLASLAPMAPSNVERGWLIVGRVDPGKGQGVLYPAEVVERNDIKTSEGHGDEFTLRFENAAGGMILEFSFSRRHEIHDRGKPQPDDNKKPFTFWFLVPYDESAARIALVDKGGNHLAELRKSAHAPQVTIGSKFTGGVSGQQKLEWSAADADGDALIFSLEYSPNQGRDWWPLQVGLRQTSTTVNFDNLPGSSNGSLRVVASDGMNSTTAILIGMRVPSHVPTVSEITRAVIDLNPGPDAGSPAAASPNSPNQSPPGPNPGNPAAAQVDYFLQADAFDWEDGPLVSPEVYSWSSDKGGVFGKGQWVTTQSLGAGPHVITLTVRDSEGKTVTRTTPVTLQRPAAAKAEPPPSP